jgi:hypothetical protein
VVHTSVQNNTLLCRIIRFFWVKSIVKFLICFCCVINSVKISEERGMENNLCEVKLWFGNTVISLGFQSIPLQASSSVSVHTVPTLLLGGKFPLYIQSIVLTSCGG